MLIYFSPPPIPRIDRTQDPAAIVHDGWIRAAWQSGWGKRLAFALMIGPFVGWDIAMLDSGPCLVEGNGRPDVELIQRPYRQPLGNSRFGRLLAEHVLQTFGTGSERRQTVTLVGRPTL